MPATETSKVIRTLKNSVNIHFLFASAALFLLLFSVDFWVTGSFISKNPEPQMSGLYVLRSTLIFLSALFLVISLTFRADTRSHLKFVPNFATVSLGPSRRIGISTRLVIWVTLILPVIFLLVFLADPGMFATLSSEDQIIETGSAFLWLLSSVWVIILLVTLRGVSLPHKWMVLGGLAGLALVFFLIGMEEISWFQRSFALKTPVAFSGNSQGEMNFHNFASNETEIAYYFASYIFLVLFPFAFIQIHGLNKFAGISFFAPDLIILLAGAPMTAFSYNLWNNLTIQFAFFSTAIIVIYLTAAAISRPDSSSFGYRLYWVALGAALIIIQIAFLWKGHLQVLGWEVTEYKESLIPLAFFVYTAHLIQKTEKRIGPKYLAPAGAVLLVFFGLRVLQEFLT